MKTKKKSRKTALKKARSRRKVNKISRLISGILKGSRGKSRKKKEINRPHKMSNNKPIGEGSTNEESTVKLVRKLLGDETVDAIPGSEEEANLLQDLDLLVLGSSPEEYKRYRELLRKEYSHLDDNSYKQMRLKLSGAQPSISRQAAAVNSDSGPSTSRSNNKSPHSKKPFTKFKDDKYRTAQIRKYKSKLKKKNVHSSLHLPTIACTTPSQVLSRKILRSVRKRRNPLSRPGTIQNSTEMVPSNDRFSDLSIRIPNTPKTEQEVPIYISTIKTKEKNEDLDDDCVCIDPQPDVILIDDESIVSCNTTNLSDGNNQTMKEYQPIGSMRMNHLNMLTSTPKLHSNSPSGYPFYDDTTPKYGTLKPDNLLSRIEDCTLVEQQSTNNEVVVIDDTTIPSHSTVRGRKRKSCNTDDSVIFVSEGVIETVTTAALAYIPLVTPVEESHFRVLPSPPQPKVKRPRNDLFSSKEQKQLKEYNDNAYNPNKDDATQLTKKRMVIIDGSNVAYHHALNKAFSVKGLKICLDYFEKMGHEVKAVVPQFRLQRLKSTDPTELEKLHQDGKIVFTPCKNLPGKSSTSYDDRFVLQLASELDAAVVSNDNYRDLIHENPAFKKIIENRVVGYTWCNDIFILPKDPYGKWGPTLSMILNRS